MLCSTEDCGGKLYCKGFCRLCYDRAWREANRESTRASGYAWYLRNAASESAKVRAKRAENLEETRARERERRDPDKHRTYNRTYYDAHPERIRARKRARYAEHRDTVQEQNEAWRKANPEKQKAYNHKRRLVVANSGTYTPEEWLNLLAFYGALCPCCGEAKPLTVDHVVPLSKGGTNTIDNIQPLCKPCNSTKGNRHTTRYLPIAKNS